QHLNIFNMLEWVHDGGSFGEGPISATEDNLVNRINEGHDPLVQFNHPAPEHYNSFAFKPVMVDKTHLMEIQYDEAAHNVVRSVNAGHFAAFRLALNNGWKVSPVANSDMHAEYGTVAYPGNFTQFRRRTGVALPQGQPLTRANLFAALRARRTFSSSNR